MGGLFGVLLGSAALYKLKITGHVSNKLNALTKFQVHETPAHMLIWALALTIHVFSLSSILSVLHWFIQHRKV